MQKYDPLPGLVERLRRSGALDLALEESNTALYAGYARIKVGGKRAGGDGPEDSAGSPSAQAWRCTFEASAAIG